MLRRCFLWALGLFVAVLLGGALYLIDYALSPSESFAHYDVMHEMAVVKQRYPDTEAWLDSVWGTGALRDTFVSINGTRLHAYWVAAEQPTDSVALLVHGYKNCAMQMMHIGHMYHHRLHYNIFLPDLYGHGLSTGDHIRMGWMDKDDVMQWITLADSIFGGRTKMVVHGISMGAATTMMLSGEETPSCVRAFVEDCGYTSVWDEFEGELRNQFGLPSFPLLYVASALNYVVHGWSFGQASALRQVSKCRKPMLFIHGDNDAFVPTHMVYPLYEAKGGRKALWLAPGSVHAASYKDYPEEYIERVRAFLK